MLGVSGNFGNMAGLLPYAAPFATLLMPAAGGGWFSNFRALLPWPGSYQPVNPYAGSSLMGTSARQMISPFAFRALPDLDALLDALKDAGRLKETGKKRKK